MPVDVSPRPCSARSSGSPPRSSRRRGSARPGSAGRIAHDVAAGDRLAAGAVVLEDRRDVARGGARRVRAVVERAALEALPAEVGGAALRRGVVDLLGVVLADVADEQVAGRAVEREAKRVAQAVGVDLAARVAAAGERVAGRDRVAARGARRDPQQLGEQRGALLVGRPGADERLPVTVGVVASAAVAGRDVQVAVGAEVQVAAVVVVAQAVLDLQDERALRRRDVGIGGAVPQVDPDVSARVGRVGVEAARRRVVRRERHREQPALAAGRELAARDREEGRGERDAVSDDADRAPALDDEQARGVAGRCGEVDRRGEGADRLQAQRMRARRCQQEEEGQCQRRAHG